MIDWRKSMQQTFEFYIVDPSTWRDSRPITTIKSFSIDRDLSTATLGSASINCDEDLGERYIRAYLIAIQNGVTEKVPLGTFLVQTPSDGFDGKTSSISLDAYTPLIELKGTLPSVGYSLLKGESIMDVAYTLCRENMRAPVVRSRSDKILEDDFVANLEDTWLTFLSDLISNAKFSFGLDELGRVIFEPDRDTASLQTVWTYDDDDDSILYPEIKDNRDLYDIPNVVEVVYSTSAGYKFARVVNDDPNSPVSTVNRGYTKTHRVTNPSFSGIPTQKMIDDYAVQLLRNMSCLEHTISYSHGYCPVRVGDCVLVNYKRAGLENVKAKVVTQSIDCAPGCRVQETAVYTTRLWG